MRRWGGSVLLLGLETANKHCGTDLSHDTLGTFCLLPRLLIFNIL